MKKNGGGWSYTFVVYEPGERNFHIPCMSRTQNTKKKISLVAFLLHLTVSLSQRSYDSLFQHVKHCMTVFLSMKLATCNFTANSNTHVCKFGQTTFDTHIVLISLFILLQVLLSSWCSEWKVQVYFPHNLALNFCVAKNFFNNLLATWAQKEFTYLLENLTENTWNSQNLLVTWAHISLWRHVLIFIIVTKILSTLFISTIIIIMIIIIGSINNIIVPIIVIIIFNINNTLLAFSKLLIAQSTCSIASPLKIKSVPSVAKVIWYRVWALKSRVLVPLYPLLWIFLFHKNLWTFGCLLFLVFFILNIDLSTISSVLPIFYFPLDLQDWVEGGVVIFSFGQEGGLAKNSVWCWGGGLLKNSALLKNILFAPTPLQYT